MRLLHTSDWHLGQTLHQFERCHEHDHFLAWLCDTLVAERVDALLIAGDIFDNSNPPASAQARFYQFLSEARRRVPGIDIVIAAGNHDSPGRLEAPAPLLALFDATVIGAVAGTQTVDLERLVVPLHDEGGAIAAWCIAMPFLRPGDVPRIDNVANPYLAGIEALYRAAFELAQSRRQPGQAIVALGHCHLAGGQVSEDSERSIAIGGAEVLSASTFDPAIAYVALGHLHFAQCVGHDATRRYSGSPLPLSFSEIDYPHQVVVVDLERESVGEIRALRVPRAVDLLRVPAKPAPLDEVLAALATLGALALPALDPAQWPYLQVRVQLTQPEPGLRALIDAAIEQLPLRLARIETSYLAPVADASVPTLSIDDLAARSPADFFDRLYRHRFGDAAPAELMAAFAELLNTPSEAPVES
ncbi:MAG: sbcD [Proteobacteria bacterium]|nr:sbcD [Pseudomonadota bacterium]